MSYRTCAVELSKVCLTLEEVTDMMNLLDPQIIQEHFLKANGIDMRFKKAVKEACEQIRGEPPLLSVETDCKRQLLQWCLEA